MSSYVEVSKNAEGRLLAGPQLRNQ